MLKNNTLYVNKFTIQLKTINHNDYFSLSDLAKYKSTNSKDVIRNWMKNIYVHSRIFNNLGAIK